MPQNSPRRHVWESVIRSCLQCFSLLFILFVKVSIHLCARGYTCWYLGSHWEKGRARELRITILLLWFPSRDEAGCQDVTILELSGFSSWPSFSLQETEIWSCTANVLILSHFNSGKETKASNSKRQWANAELGKLSIGDLLVGKLNDLISWKSPDGSSREFLSRADRIVWCVVSQLHSGACNPTLILESNTRPL